MLQGDLFVPFGGGWGRIFTLFENLIQFVFPLPPPPKAGSFHSENYMLFRMFLSENRLLGIY